MSYFILLNSGCFHFKKNWKNLKIQRFGPINFLIPPDFHTHPSVQYNASASPFEGFYTQQERQPPAVASSWSTSGPFSRRFTSFPWLRLKKLPYALGLRPKVCYGEYCPIWRKRLALRRQYLFFPSSNITCDLLHSINSPPCF